MTRTMTPADRPTRTVDRLAPTASAVLHGMHPLRGYAVTWHLTPVSSRIGGAVTFVVERADGVIDDDLVWQLAEKDTVVMTTAEACDLVRRVTLTAH